MITLVVEGEPRTLVPGWAEGPGSAAEHLFELVHQSLITYDDEARPIPRLALERPSIERGTWRVFADGTMETVWQLRPNVRWHDGAPFTADDVVFSWRLFNDPAVPVASRRVARLIESIESPTLKPSSCAGVGGTPSPIRSQASISRSFPSHLLEATYELRESSLPTTRTGGVSSSVSVPTEWPLADGQLDRAPSVRGVLPGCPEHRDHGGALPPRRQYAMAAVLSGSVDVILPRREVLGIVRSVRDRWAGGAEGTLSSCPGTAGCSLTPQFQGPQNEELGRPPGTGRPWPMRWIAHHRRGRHRRPTARVRRLGAGRRPTL